MFAQDFFFIREKCRFLVFSHYSAVEAQKVMNKSTSHRGLPSVTATPAATKRVLGRSDLYTTQLKVEFQVA